MHDRLMDLAEAHVVAAQPQTFDVPPPPQVSGEVQLHVVTVQTPLQALSNDASTTGLDASA